MFLFLGDILPGKWCPDTSKMTQALVLHAPMRSLQASQPHAMFEPIGGHVKTIKT